MTALAIERKTPQLGQTTLPDYPTNAVDLAANAKLYAGAIVCMQTAGTDAGKAVAGTAARGLIALGRAESTVDNTGGVAGAKQIVPRAGVFQFNNSAGGDAIAAQHVGQPCYIVDDNTVALTAGVGARSAAGMIVAVDSLGVWVLMGPMLSATLIQPLAEFQKAAADAAASTATAETAFERCNYFAQVSAVFYTPSAALTGDGTNNAVITVRKRDGAGGAAAAVAALTTTASWTAFTPVSLGAITNGALTPGNVLTLEIAKGGTGVVVPSGILTVL